MKIIGVEMHWALFYVQKTGRNSLESYNVCKKQLKHRRNKQTKSIFSVPKTQLWALTELISTFSSNFVDVSLACDLNNTSSESSNVQLSSYIKQSYP